MNILKIFVTGLLIIVFINLSLGKISAQTSIVQDNPLLILHTSTPPKIDGIGDDLCWQSAKWQSIGKVWIPYNGTVASSNYTGRYKVMWSSVTNLLYFLIEVYDDVLVDGYNPSIKNGEAYNYDISEVFIDENHSGGEHRWDGPTTNAENAFAYHMYCAIPPDGGVITTPYIEDMVGTQANSKWIEHTSHIPEFALRRTGNTCVREFSLIVYNDTYTEENKDAARVLLQVGKTMGLSVAYCDNDHPNKTPKARDNMYGSVVEPSPGNLHWMNADYFGTAKLTDDLGTGINNINTLPTEFALYQNYPNPFNPETVISYRLSAFSFVTLKVFDPLGREVATLVNQYLNPGIHNSTFNIQNYSLPSGIYFYRLTAGNYSSIKKMVLLK